MFTIILLFIVFSINHAVVEITGCSETCRCSDHNPAPGELCLFSCDQNSDACKESDLYCDTNNPCELRCKYMESCEDTKFFANDATDATIQCDSQGSDVCKDGEFYCGTGVCKLSCYGSCSGVTIDIQPTTTAFYCNSCSTNLNDLQFTPSPTSSPTNPTKSPSNNPSKSPTKSPTKSPSNNPSKFPTKSPTLITNNPTKSPTKSPTNNPTISPTLSTTNPSITPSKFPTKSPTPSPTNIPSYNPSVSPSKNPTYNPSNNPTKIPTTNTLYPSTLPSINPTITPTKQGHVNEAYETTLNKDNGNNNAPNAKNKMSFLNSIIFLIVGFIITCGICCCVLIFYKKRSNKKPEQIKNKRFANVEINKDNDIQLKRIQSTSMTANSPIGKTYTDTNSKQFVSVASVELTSIMKSFNAAQMVTPIGDGPPTMLEGSPNYNNNQFINGDVDNINNTDKTDTNELNNDDEDVLQGVNNVTKGADTCDTDDITGTPEDEFIIHGDDETPNDTPICTDEDVDNTLDDVNNINPLTPQ